MKKIDTVLFDFDGTVMDTNDVILKSWQHTFKTLTGKEGDEEYIFSTFGEILEDSMRKTFPNHDTKKVVDIYRSYHYDNFIDLIHLFPGIEDLLKEIKNRHHKMALVTSRMARTTMQAVDAFDLDRYFDEIVTMEDCTKFKPDPQPIEIALKRVDSLKENSVMVGDSMLDLGCAKNAGVPFAMVGWSVAVDPYLLKGDETPELIISEPKDLLDIL